MRSKIVFCEIKGRREQKEYPPSPANALFERKVVLYKMLKKRIWKLLCCFLLMTASILPLTTATAAESTQKESNAPCVASIKMISPTNSAPSPEHPCAALSLAETPDLATSAYQGLTVIPGGMPFGVKFYTEGVTVVGFCDVETRDGNVTPARAAGIKQKDMMAWRTLL